MFLPFAAGYYVSFLFRNVNSVVFPELTHAFDLSPGTLGLLTSVYFLAFAGAQLPLGMLMDRYGPHRVNATMLLDTTRSTDTAPLSHCAGCCKPRRWRGSRTPSAMRQEA